MNKLIPHTSKIFILSFLLVLSSCCTDKEPDSFEHESLNPPKLPNNIGSNEGIKIELDK